MVNAHAKSSHIFRVLCKKKARVKACVLSAFLVLFIHSFIVIQGSQLALFCIVSENKGFPSQNADAEALNQYLHISASKGAKAADSVKC